ncbi:MAG: single-stranded-DNA-specific exonuclease RecJ [Campylobacterales bacterium]|nr:single-stranded-DNA-specific exonuclease RecJ [Campylobacterales bacterium]
MAPEHPTIDSLEQLQAILSNRFSEGFLTLKDLPHPHTLKDMHKATQRIVQAIRKGEKIVLIGDYDVDGVVSTALMRLFFDEIGVELTTIIPNRFRDGYGLSSNIIPRIADFDLAITVDNGISAVEAAKMCTQFNIELIITDHHLLPPTLPNAYAIVDQKQIDCDFPYKEICGAQIAWYLISSLKIEMGVDIDTKSYLELVAIAVIADVMPLLHINRAIVVAGLQLINQSSRPALQAIKEKFGKESVNSEDIGFLIAPILNSAGRMEDASYALDLLISRNIYEARDALEVLIEFNTKRKAIEESITKAAIERANGDDSVIVVHGEEWNEGVVGIVAARVASHFKKPTIILSQKGERLKGSGRSYGECNLFEIVSQAKEYLEGFGGHKAAVGLGLKLENLEAFKAQLQTSYQSKSYDESIMDETLIGSLDFDLIDFRLTKLLSQYEPYGHENSKPKFITQDVEVMHFDKIGKNQEHLRLIVAQNGISYRAIKFKTDITPVIGQKVTITYYVNENHFRGEVSIQLMVDEILQGD